MEEEKAAALYEELTRKGGGAARFKQGLGFSSATTTSNDPPSRGSALPSSSSSFMSNFVRASSQAKEIEVDKKTQIENIQNKLKKKEPISSTDKIRVRDKDRRRSSSREKNLRTRSRSRSRSRERRRRSRSRSRSRERRKRSTSRDREKDLRSRRRNGGFDEDRDGSRRRYRSSSRERRRKRSRGRRSRSRSRSFSPTDRRRSERRSDGGGRDTKMVKESGNGTVDYAKSIDGYDNMTPAERVKAKMKLQLSQTAQKDTNLGSSSQWERFDFNKDAPVDDKEIEAADDDASLVKHIGRSFRFTSLEAKREDEIENAHDQAIFGIPAPILSYTSETEERGGENKNVNENKGSTNDDDPASSLISEKVLSKQQGSWRDRARKNAG